MLEAKLYKTNLYKKFFLKFVKKENLEVSTFANKNQTFFV